MTVVNTESFRYPIGNIAGKVDPEVEMALRVHDNSLVDLRQAIASLKSQVTTASTTATTSTTTNVSTTTESITNIASTILGYVNDQTGAIAYATLQADYGKYIILDDASPVSVTLTSTGFTLPWYADFLNLGAGTATLTPATGTITYAGNVGAASMPITQGYFASVVFDGTNFWAELIPIVPVTTAAIVHEWLASYNAATGAFTQTQPAFTDISGVAAPSQLPTPTTSTIGGVEAIVQVASNWINSINTSGVPQLSQPAIADISGLVAALALLAPLASPTFTGSIISPVVYGGSAAGSTLTLDGTSNGTPSNAFVLINPSSQGNVGIGTATPQSTLQINGRETLDDSGNFELMANGVFTSVDQYLSTGYAGRFQFNRGLGNWYFQTAPLGSAGSAVTYTAKMTILNGGNVGIGTATPGSKLSVVGLPVYANNAAAITGGLAAGDFYRTGADPDPVCVVH